MEEKRRGFLATYFSKDAVLRLADLAKILSWVIGVIYALDFMLQLVIMTLQITRGFWNGLGLTDYAQNVLMVLERPLRGVVYFVVLQGVAQVLLMFMDVEDNTRRAVENPPKRGK